MNVLKVIFFAIFSIAIFWIVIGGIGKLTSIINFHSILICLAGGGFYLLFQVNQSSKLKRFYNGTYSAALLSVLAGLIFILKGGVYEAEILPLYIGNNLIVLFYACFINEFLIKGILYYESDKK